MTADIAPAELQPLVERFAKSFAAFVKEAEDAVSDAARDPELAGTPAYQAWRGKVLPLLQLENASLNSALAQFQTGDVRPVLVAAEDKRGLAKDMDGFPLTFAGADHAQVLGDLRTAVVRNASRLCAAAGIP